ncbi:MAG: hypothetical protein COB66_08200 [Coxiella sp. (in: Bacteria)]|nr:MAG: hypothetical protein COB66_08200 [Coxiella sp. (in: g-proteobacteria)]
MHYLEDHSSHVENNHMSADLSANRSASLRNALGLLDERSRDILEQRWLSEDKQTLHQLAAKYDVSAERIRQLEKNAMNKLRGAIGS